MVVQLIETLAEKLKRQMGMRNVLAITSAKVPIVKLVHPRSRIEADISLYNVLARYGTSGGRGSFIVLTTCFPVLNSVPELVVSRFFLLYAGF